MNDPRLLLPKHKSDTTNAQALIELGYPAVEPVIPEMLEWLQDYNWPVAQVLAPFLSNIGLDLIPHLCSILQTTDELWQYWIMTLIIAKSREVAQELCGELLRFAENPTPDERAAELDIIAQDILSNLSDPKSTES